MVDHCSFLDRVSIWPNKSVYKFIRAHIHILLTVDPGEDVKVEDT